MSVAAKSVPSPAIDLTTWNLIYGEVEDLLSKCVTETLRKTFEQDPPSFRFGIIYDDEEDVADPLRIVVDLPLGADDCSYPEFEVSLTALIDDVIDEDIYPKHCKLLAEGLRGLADKLERACTVASAQE